MKSTGIVRKVDELGRIVVPKELRRILDINVKDPIEIFVQDEKVILRKYKPNRKCMITGEVDDSNLVVNENLVLSKNGASQLIDQLQRYLNR